MPPSPSPPPPEATLQALTELPLLHLDCTLKSDALSEGRRAQLEAYFLVGRLLRGALGYGLREMACLGVCEGGPNARDKRCGVAHCAYELGFGGTEPTVGQPQRAASFRLSPLPSNKPALRFRLTLFGEATKTSIFWILGLQRGVQRGLKVKVAHAPFDLLEVCDEGGRRLWHLEEAPHPQPATPRSLWRPITAVEPLGGAVVRVTFESPFESRLYDSSRFESERNAPRPIALAELLLMIKRRLEELSEAHSEAHSEAPVSAPFSRAQLCSLCEESELLSHALHQVLDRGAKLRRVKRVVGELIYRLPTQEEASRLIWVMLQLGCEVGVGRGGVEGRGAMRLARLRGV